MEVEVKLNFLLSKVSQFILLEKQLSYRGKKKILIYFLIFLFTIKRNK